MLGFPEEQSTARRGWLPAVLAGGKLYLYDTALGLPLPGPDGKGIATLDQVIKDPQLLRRLDLPDVATYPVTEKDLKLGVLALIDAEPAALSRRMQLLQDAMPSATRLALSTRPSEIEPKLRKTNVSGVSLWSVPFEAIFYRFGQKQAAARDQEVAREAYQRSVLFAPTRPLIKGRNLHLQGRFENEDQKLGARALYLQCRPPDREIDAMETNDAYRKAIGLDRALPEDPAQKKAMLDMFMGIARQGKFNATYWLGLTYYDAGKPGPAIEWLTRTVQGSPPSTWVPGGYYNLARCYEQLGNHELARQWLEADKESPQRHGNLLRARSLPKKGLRTE
jgi:tetratricopeptide (TPR) repeat protein